MRRRLSGNIGSLSFIFRKERKMKYEICSTCRWNPDKLLEKYPMLNNFGFEAVDKRETFKRIVPVLDENGDQITQLQDCSRTVRRGYVTLYTLEQLNELIYAVEEEIVITQIDDCIYRIEIYDDYREWL